MVFLPYRKKTQFVQFQASVDALKYRIFHKSGPIQIKKKKTSWTWLCFSSNQIPRNLLCESWHGLRIRLFCRYGSFSKNDRIPILILICRQSSGDLVDRTFDTHYFLLLSFSRGEITLSRGPYPQGYPRYTFFKIFFCIFFFLLFVLN